MKHIILAVLIGAGFTATASPPAQTELPTVTVYPDPVISMIDRLSRQIIAENAPGADLLELVPPQAQAAEPLDAPDRRADARSTLS